LEIANLLKADLSSAHLERARLGYANLNRAALVQAHLEEADLSHAQLRQAFLVEANLARANLTGAYLSDAQLAGAKGVEQARVDWIDVGAPDAPQRLEGEEARSWLLAEVAKPLPEGLC
ncbi:MAG TPA: pentapeptide repeat-containing protein, partial [Ktedonobacteraceae bacterium]|nr:pentapeptide repeat-containing protein [Ktedonobacteraceae bacterium]